MSYLHTCLLSLFGKERVFSLDQKVLFFNLLFEERMLVPVLYY